MYCIIIKKITQAVVTIPSYFNYNQIKLIKYVARIAGLQVLRCITAPVAASLVYGFDKMDLSQKILVYDLGGGTFNVSILDLGDGVFDVLSTNGDINFGGDDFDEKIMKYIADKFKAENGIDLLKDKMAVERLKEAAETAKIELSSSTQTNIYLPYITSDVTGPKHIERNSTIPTKRSTVFSTSTDNQTSVQVNVFQGERVLVIDNELLGELTFSGIAPAQKGIPQIEVALDIDANGIIKVLALDKGTGKEESVIFY